MQAVRQEKHEAMRAHVHVGTSGWSYPQWRGTFYPPRLADRERLGFYARHFDCVELNTSFYRLPAQVLTQRWAAAVPEKFKFCCKVWQKITHEKKLADADGTIEAFLDSLAPLAEKRGPLLLQLPPKLTRASLPNLTQVLKKFHQHGWPVAVEFRDRTWYVPEVYDVLDTFESSAVLHDMPVAPCTQPNAGAPFIYVRYHGLNGTYRGSYGPDVLAALKQRVPGWRAEGKDVYAFFNNTMGTATENARELLSII